MYNEILQGVKNKHSLTSDNAVNNHLKNLQNKVISLRQAFRIFPVRFDYKDVNIQQAYMFAYYPHYTELLEYALNSAKDSLNNDFPSNLLLFGSGPCPEIIGYLKFLNGQTQLKKMDLSVSIFDIASTHWEYSRDITFNEIIPSYKNGHTISKWSSKDFKINLPLVKVNLSEPQLVVYQNCLNEIDLSDYDTIKSNFEKLYDNLPSNSIIAIIDFHEYPDVVTLISAIQESLSSKNGFTLLRDINLGVINKKSSYRNPPPIIRENLMTGIPFEIQNGLIPRSTVKFTYSLIRKE
mgnify:CR=1 FL=1